MNTKPTAVRRALAFTNQSSLKFKSPLTMKSTFSLLDLFQNVAHPMVLSFLLFAPIAVRAESAPALVDDFSNTEHMTNGMPRMIITDKDAGGQSQAQSSFNDGIVATKGTLAPGRGAPGFISIPLILAADGSPQDVSQFEGVRILVKVDQGTLMVQVASSEIVNFDFHTSAPLTRRLSEFTEVRIPFADLKRAWSAQTPLNLQTITSINLVSAGMAPGAFAYEIDEIGFY